MMRIFEIAVWSVLVVVGAPVFGVLTYTLVGPTKIETSPNGVADEILKARPSSVSPYGELARTFRFFSDATDAQRSALEREITGKVVHWHLPVYNVLSRGSDFIIQTKSDDRVVGAFCHVKATTEQIRKRLIALREGDHISCKGRIASTTMRNIDIDPAVLTQ